MTCKKPQGGRADHIDAQVIYHGMLKCGARKLCGKAAATKRRWHLGMPDGHPSGGVRLEFEIGSLSVFVDFEFVRRPQGAPVVHMEEYTCRQTGVGTNQIRKTIVGEVIGKT